MKDEHFDRLLTLAKVSEEWKKYRLWPWPGRASLVDKCGQWTWPGCLLREHWCWDEPGQAERHLELMMRWSLARAGGGLGTALRRDPGQTASHLGLALAMNLARSVMFWEQQSCWTWPGAETQLGYGALLSPWPGRGYVDDRSSVGPGQTVISLDGWSLDELGQGVG